MIWTSASVPSGQAGSPCCGDEAAKPWDLLSPVEQRLREDQGGPPKEGDGQRGDRVRHEERNGCLIGEQRAGGSGSATRYQVHWLIGSWEARLQTLEEP